MAKFDGVLLCSDYDNTIVDTAAVMRGEIEESLPGERTIKALEYFMANGGRVAVAQAGLWRPLPAMPKMCPPMRRPSFITAVPSTTLQRRPCWSRII